MDKFSKIVDHAKNKKAELIEVQLAMARGVEEKIKCDISEATDDSSFPNFPSYSTQNQHWKHRGNRGNGGHRGNRGNGGNGGNRERKNPSIEDIILMSQLFEFSLNSAYREAGLKKNMVDFSFYESCLLDEETLESLECVHQSNRQLRRRSRLTRRRLRGRGNGNNYRANAAISKKLRSNHRSLTSIQEDPTHDAMEPNHKHVEVHRRVNTIDADFFVQHVDSQFGILYMKMFDTEVSVHCSLDE
eukprot:scaffold50225_cov39-Attheya_sp.AAC.2